MIRLAILLASGCHLAFPLEAPPPDPCADPDLVLCFDFEGDSSSGVMEDRSPQGNNATVPKDLQRVRRSTSDGISVTEDTIIEIKQHDSLDRPADLTIDLWFGFDSVPARYAGLLDNDAQYGMSFEPDGTVKCMVVVATLIQQVVSRPLDPADWHHVACTRQDDKLAVYVDGEFDASVAVLGQAQTASTQPIFIGRDGDGSGVPMNPFTGRLDDVRIFARALSDAAIRAYVDAAR